MCQSRLYRFLSYPLIKILFFLIFFAPSSQSQVAKKGFVIFDKNDESLEKVVDISGGWQFYFGKLLNASEMRNINKKDKHFVNIPSSWSNIKVDGKKLPAYGICTYYLQILMDTTKRDPYDIYGIRIKNISSAYKLWVDDRLIMHAGNAADSLGFEPMYFPQTGYFNSESDTINVILHVSNYFETNYSGPSDKIYFGEKNPIRQFTFDRETFSIFLLSLLILLCFFQLFFAYVNNGYSSHIVLALLSALFFFKMLLDSEVTIFHFIPGFDYHFGYRLWMLSFLAIPLVFRLISDSFPDEINKYTQKTVYLIYPVLSILILTLNLNFVVSHIHYVIYLSFFYAIYMIAILARAVYRKRNYSVLHIVSFSIMLLTFINDLIYVANQQTIGYLSQIGVCFYIIVQSVIISKKFANSQRRVIELKDELEITNQNLEVTVDSRTKELNESNTKLEILLRQKDFLISTISHDLKNSFNILLNFSYILSSGNGLDDNEKEDLAKRLYDTSHKGYKILENILDWAKLQISNKSETKEITSLSFIINEVIQLFSDQINEKSIQTVTQIDNSLRFRCDESQMHAILRNLLSNSVKFSSIGGKVVFRNEIKDGLVIITVHDEGIGIPENIASSIFDYSTSKKREGTSGEQGIGLGLLIVKELVEANNGVISCNSKPGKFTDFVISFPTINK